MWSQSQKQKHFYFHTFFTIFSMTREPVGASSSGAIVVSELILTNTDASTSMRPASETCVVPNSRTFFLQSTRPDVFAKCNAAFAASLLVELAGSLT
jgi:hypothetical protein